MPNLFISGNKSKSLVLSLSARFIDFPVENGAAESTSKGAELQSGVQEAEGPRVKN